MDPISILGVVAGAVQLLDASIKSSKKARSFINAFRHTNDNIQHLETEAIKEAEALMNDLQTYATAVQQCPPDALGPHSHVLSSSLCQIALNYSEDMKDLANLLPSNSTLPMKERFSLARDQKAISGIIFRLEQRKTATILALEILGRIEGMKHHTRGLKLEQNLQALSLQQSLLSADLGKCVDVITEQGQKGIEREANILSSVKQRQDLVLRGEQANAEIRHLLLEQADQLSLIDTQVSDTYSSSAKNSSTLLQLMRDVESQRSEVQASLASMEARVTARHCQLATTSQVKTIAANSTNELGKIVRLELKKQLEPLAHRLEVTDQIIDTLATAVGSQASSQKVFERDNLEDATKTQSLGQGFDNIDETLSFSSSSYRERKTSPTQRAVRLFTYTHYRDTSFGFLSFLITTYRTKDICIQDSSAHFRLKVNFIPRPWLISRGLSVMYFSGPGPDGYFDICPKFRSFGVLPDDSPVWSLLDNDDISGFRKALQTRQIGLWDVNRFGLGLLELSLFHYSWDISLYLLRETGYVDMFLADHDLDLGTCLTIIAGHLPDRSTAQQIISSINQNSDPPDEIRVSDSHVIWHNLWNSRRVKNCHGPRTRTLEARQVVLLCKEYGISLEPPDFFIDRLTPWSESLSKLEYLLELYLETGGDPNYEFEDGDPLLIAVLIHARDSREAHLKNSDLSDEDTHEFDDASDFSEHGCDSSFSEDEDIQLCPNSSRKWRYSRLLALLILSGADIYWLWTDDSTTSHHHTIFELASMLGVSDIWLASLREYGLSPYEVFEESIHQMRRVDKLGGAERTGVDVTNIVKTPDMRGLRCRGLGREFSDG